jgi:hypothetical protein
MKRSIKRILKGYNLSRKQIKMAMNSNIYDEMNGIINQCESSIDDLMCGYFDKN